MNFLLELILHFKYSKGSVIRGSVIRGSVIRGSVIRNYMIH
ncbi:hypothetical protein TPHV1_30194 [Treponema phagedenis]|uniref:Uncharacterized protein n=1 Tax=Treponema phagedenis TaxID=162 RepID=A0A0B7GUE6_TREPH|nr:hypothetical protein TPHV1_30194 [Treponema phagedenis]